MHNERSIQQNLTVGNERIRGPTKPREILKKVEEGRSRWYGNLMRKDDDYIRRDAMGTEVQWRSRGRPKRRWLGNLRV